MTYETSTTRAPSTHALAIVSIILAFLGLVSVLPLVGGIGAIITGRIARREIAAQPDVHGGDNLARAGIVLGWVGVIMAVAGLCLVAAALLFYLPVTSVTSFGG